MTGGRWQESPEWLVYAVRAHHVGKRPEDEAVDRLTARILGDDPEFARVVIARYVRSLVRAPKPRKREKNRDRDRLLADCVRMSAEGMSLRAIGEEKRVSHTAVRKLIAEWRTRLPEMSPELIRLATPGGNPERKPGPIEFPAQVSSNPTVIPLRRPA